jgi:EpsD family peptidyl-prolyl cis-trans isomerase
MIVKRTLLVATPWCLRGALATRSARRIQTTSIGLWLCVFSFALALPPTGFAASQAGPSTVAASVNGVPITEAEVASMLTRALKLGTIKEISGASRARILEDLIYMRLAEQAIDADGDAFNREGVQQELALTRLQTLLNIYLDKRAASARNLSPEETAAFIADHPEFFKDRRIYYFTQIDIDRKKQIDLVAVKTYAQSAQRLFHAAQTPEEKDKAFSKLNGYIQAVAGKFSATKGWKSTEELDPSVFAQLKQMKDGEALVDDGSNPSLIRVLMLQASQPVPIDADQSSQVAAQMIHYKEMRRAADRLYGELRARANVRYGKNAERVVAKSSSVLPSRSSVTLATSTVFHGAFRWEQLWTVWIASLIVLLPAALVQFHRKAVAARARAYFVDEDVFSSIINRVKLFSLTPLFEIILAIVLLIASIVAWMALANVFSLFSNPIVFVTMGLSGVVAAALMLVIASRYASRLPSDISDNRWLPIAGVLLVPLVGILFAVAA